MQVNDTSGLALPTQCCRRTNSDNGYAKGFAEYRPLTEDRQRLKDNNRAAFAALNMLQYITNITSPEKIDLPTEMEERIAKPKTKTETVVLKENQLNIYPNPATDNVTITWNSKIDLSKGIVTVYNCIGEKVNISNGNSSVNTKTINTANLNAGLYNVTIAQGNKLYYGRIIIEK